MGLVFTKTNIVKLAVATIQKGGYMYENTEKKNDYY